MKDILQAWDFKTIQEFVNISLHLRNKGKTLEDVQRYIEEYSKKLEDTNERVTITLCPECNYSMILTPVNDHPARMIGGKSKAMWWCPNPDCNYTIEVL